jgi:hypothetical protein
MCLRLHTSSLCVCVCVCVCVYVWLCFIVFLASFQVVAMCVSLTSPICQFYGLSLELFQMFAKPSKGATPAEVEEEEVNPFPGIRLHTDGQDEESQSTFPGVKMHIVDEEGESSGQSGSSADEEELERHIAGVQSEVVSLQVSGLRCCLCCCLCGCVLFVCLFFGGGGAPHLKAWFFQPGLVFRNGFSPLFSFFMSQCVGVCVCTCVTEWLSFFLPLSPLLAHLLKKQSP